MVRVQHLRRVAGVSALTPDNFVSFRFAEIGLTAGLYVSIVISDRLKMSCAGSNLISQTQVSEIQDPGSLLPDRAPQKANT
jgi:hypothetical protein